MKRGEFWNGKHHSEMSKIKMSKSAKKRKVHGAMGYKHQKESIDKIREFIKKQWEDGFYDNRPNLIHKGKDNPSWKGGIAKRSLNTKEYRAWRIKVFSRDNFTCQNCGQIGGYLEAHHIKRWVDCIKSRFDVKNGQTLCKDCHNSTKKRSKTCIKKN